MIRFIHTADLHIDSPFKGLKQVHPVLFESIYHSTFDSFHRIVSVAIESEVDFLLISGDIYDEENQSVKAQAFFRKEMKRLEEVSIPVYLLHGNHDFMGRETETLRIQMPKNVHIFGVEPETKEFISTSNEKVALTGFSYPTRWVRERMIEQYPSRYKEVDFHLGMLHGYMEGSGAREGVYAPFTLEDLLTRQYDYWALGHIHKRAVLHSAPPVIYPGNIQGRNPNEGEGKGAYLVTLQKGMTSKVEYFETAPIIWRERTLDLNGITSLEGLYGSILEAMEEAAEGERDVLLSLQLTQYQGLSSDVITRIEDGDLLEGLNQTEKQPLVYMYRLSLVAQKERLLFKYDEKMQQSFERSRQDFMQEERFKAVLQDLYKHQTIRTKFSKLIEEEAFREEIMQAAENQLMEDIAFEEGEE
ncbi:metallophosphoesterase family protein [Jeotgalibaca caeni]|uniref:metallophosphoesterase family protein n=1 Tax=Jeotgalibaca caeni TaxID=3028623 RepID=UPI00237EDC78|nr:DNA repair exonuclease [Jeotgalibaca caeni]MDE1548374.1 DNA repair exonuclease [Jeotgalibaca caeni]